MFRLALVAFLSLNLLTPTFAQEQRLALLIGNKSYAPQVGTLNNPGNDVAIIARSLEEAGFKVKVVLDASRATMLREINTYSIALGSLGPGAVGFFYYSGHGVSRPQYDTNYLIPVDVISTSDSDFWWNAVALNDITSELKINAPEASSFVIIDACRNQLRVPLKSVAKGFTGMTGENGMFIGLSTSPNTSSSDEGEGGGPYAKALASELTQPGLDNLQIFQNVKRKVYAATRGAQRTWESNGLLDPIVFKQPDAQAIASPAPTVVEQSKPPILPTPLSPQQVGLSGKPKDFCADVKALVGLSSQGFAAIRRGAPDQNDNWKTTFILPPYGECSVRDMSNVTYICRKPVLGSRDKGVSELKKASEDFAKCLGAGWQRSSMNNANGVASFLSLDDYSLGIFLNEVPAFGSDKKPSYAVSFQLYNARYEEKREALKSVIDQAPAKFKDIVGAEYMKGSFRSKVLLKGWDDCDISDFESSPAGRRWFSCKAMKLESAELADAAVQALTEDVSSCLGDNWRTRTEPDHNKRLETRLTSPTIGTTLDLRSRRSGKLWNLVLDVNMSR
jgi:hypothetical protein